VSSFVVVLLLVGPALAQRGTDLLDQYKARVAIEAQKFENEMRDLVAEAQRTAATDPARAVEMLKGALAKIEGNEVLSPSRRDSMARDFRERMRVIDADARRAAGNADEDARRRAQAAANKTAVNQEMANQEKLMRQLDQVKVLRDAGRNDEANRLAAELREQYPDNPVVILTARNGITNDRLNEYYRLLNERERRLLAVQADIQRSATPIAGDIEFPSAAKWAEITKMRSNTQRLTPQEKAILQALETPITLDLPDGKLEETLQWISDKFKIPFIIDKASMDQLMIGYDAPVKIKARQISTRTVLRKILGEVGLSYVVKDQVIQIMTPDRARGMLTTRVYYIGDLLGAFDMRLPPVLNQIQTAQNLAGLMDYITKNVDPDSWAINERGGLGSIAFDPLRGALIVKQSAEVHYFLGSAIR